MEELIQLKGYRGGLRVIIDEEVPLAEVEIALIKKLEGLGDFIVGSAITLDAGKRALSDDDIRRLQNVLL
ncbi:TPA: hypothetical protein ENG04_06465, partial [Candidatus Poribacteria bacterium]|nr:hypothetical protein [Candidatus Poribacteria bacterium]HEX29707.1 hypothetical protein [Candidatus Poribacteria bacterium]